MDRPTSIRARLARAIRAEIVTDLRRDYHYARARDYVRDWISSDPAPTPAQPASWPTCWWGGEADATAA